MKNANRCKATHLLSGVPGFPGLYEVRCRHDEGHLGEHHARTDGGTGVVWVDPPDIALRLPQARGPQ